MLYARHGIYAVSHVIIGFLGAVIHPVILLIALLYQIGQYAFNIRVFPLEQEIKNGNSLDHTALKVLEIFFGYGVGKLFMKKRIVY
jgi:hypothetical protein